MRLVLALAVLFSGCARAPAAAVDAGAARPTTVALECTLETPLVPGIPGSPGHLMPSSRNPNGDSELAALMRQMQSDLEEAKGLVMKGEVPLPMWTRHRKLRCAWPTEPKDRDAAFDTFAVGYLTAVQKLDAHPANAPQAFGAVVNACRACHERACPGPIAAIDLLKIPDAR